MPYLVLFGGPAGAGKTSLAAAWCETRTLAVHIELDHVRSLIVSGLADPQGEGAAVDAQYRLSVQACCRLATIYLEAGYDVAIDDVLWPSTFERDWQPPLQDLAYRVVIVVPSLCETLQRSRGRQKRVREEHSRSQHAASLEWSEAVRLDTSGLSIAESLALARSRDLLP